ncbi:hypothetical protein [Burkholderia multivorans]|uniref:hypothetical protein n=1 Tax=Burkholderia multivorans TaxID=87883 RepID=UPI00350F0F26
MPTLQKINLGTPPAGKDGDSTRAGFVKMNANIDVINTCVALGYELITDSTTLKPAQVGTRYGINIADQGKSITIPLASSVSVNACLHFFNAGSPVTIAPQGSDGTQIGTLNKGDWATYVSDGAKYWHVAERGKMLWDETVGGNLTVGGRVLVGGAADDGSTALQVKGTASISKFTSRPNFGGNVPWDSGNFKPDQYNGTYKSIGGAVVAQSGSAASFLSSGFVFSSATGGALPTDKYAEVFHDGASAGVAVNYGDGDWQPLIAANVDQKRAGVPVSLGGRNIPVVWAYWSGNTESAGAGTAFNCSATYLGVGRLRIYLAAPFAFATHMIFVNGMPVSNGTNWAFPAMTSNAGDGGYIDVGFVISGGGAGSAVGGMIQVLIVKVR